MSCNLQMLIAPPAINKLEMNKSNDFDDILPKLFLTVPPVSAEWLLRLIHKSWGSAIIFSKDLYDAEKRHAF